MGHALPAITTIRLRSAAKNATRPASHAQFTTRLALLALAHWFCSSYRLPTQLASALTTTYSIRVEIVFVTN
jgi:hypothetical protein